MNRRHILAGLACGLFVVSGMIAAARAQSAPAGASKPALAAAARPISRNASRPASAPTTSPSRALLASAKRSFVIVQTWYKKDVSEQGSFIENNWNIANLYSEYVDKKRPREAVGVALDDNRVLICDDGVEDRFLDKILVQDVQGHSYPAQREKLLLGTSGVVLQAQAPTGALNGVRFEPLSDTTVECELYQAEMFKADDAWRLQVSPLCGAIEYCPGEPANAFYGSRMDSAISAEPRSDECAPGLIGDDKGRVVGVCLETFMDLRQQECLWQGPDLCGWESLTWKDLTAAEARIRQNLTADVYEVVIAFHQGGPGTGEEGYRSGGGLHGPVESGREISVYGVAISPTEILLPHRIDSRMAAQIETISVKLSANDRKTAEFVGAYKDFGAAVIRLRNGKLAGHIELADKDLPRMKPFWVAQPRKRFGKTYVDLATNRLYGKTRGYAGKYYWYSARPIPQEALLIDFDGRLAGLAVEPRYENEEERALEQETAPGDQTERRVFLMSDLREKLLQPGSYLDPKITVKSRIQSKRRAWLGVEFVPMNPDLAEALSVETPTKDGQIGFLVNAVYPDSPAGKMGIEVGDILLEMQAPGMAYPIPLDARMGGQESFLSMGRFFERGGEGNDEVGPPPASWRSRDNSLTRALDAIGVGKEITLTYFHPDDKGGKSVTAHYKIEQAPTDQDSASRWRNRKLGLTVKDVTYEVKMALNLGQKDPGVIIATVEEGSPTETARIFPNEIITHLNAAALTSPRQMRDLVAKAHARGQEKVRLTILRTGKTRFADLVVKAYDPQDDEGIDEE